MTASGNDDHYNWENESKFFSVDVALKRKRDDSTIFGNPSLDGGHQGLFSRDVSKRFSFIVCNSEERWLFTVQLSMPALFHKINLLLHCAIQCRELGL